MNNLKNKLNALKCEYIKKIKNEIPIYDEFLAKPKTLNNAMDLLKFIHKLSGTSGMYQLVELSQKANEFEMYLMEVKNEFTLLNSEKITLYLKVLKKMIIDLED